MEPQTPVVEPPPQPAPEPSPAPDPFSLDENSLASLSPEQRASLDPIFDTWKKKAQSEIEKRESEASSKYKPLEEKAQALDKLTSYGPFVQWWQAQQNAAASGASDDQKNAIRETKPLDVATQAEWQQAIWDASNGDSTKLINLQQKMMATWAAPVINEIRQGQQVMRTEQEIERIFKENPDAEQLNKIGIDPKTGEGVSLLELAVEWAEKNRKPLVEGYRLAKSWADSMKVGAKQEAMGMVQEKKQSVTSSSSTSAGAKNIVEVESTDELLKRSLEANLAGQKDVQFVVKGKR